MADLKVWRHAGGPDQLHKPFKSKDFFELGTGDKVIDLKQEKDSVCHYCPEDGGACGRRSKQLLGMQKNS